MHPAEAFSIAIYGLAAQLTQRPEDNEPLQWAVLALFFCYALLFSVFLLAYPWFYFSRFVQADPGAAAEERRELKFRCAMITAIQAAIWIAIALLTASPVTNIKLTPRDRIQLALPAASVIFAIAANAVLIWRIRFWRRSNGPPLHSLQKKLPYFALVALVAGFWIAFAQIRAACAEWDCSFVQVHNLQMILGLAGASIWGLLRMARAPADTAGGSGAFARSRSAPLTIAAILTFLLWPAGSWILMAL